MSKEYKIKAIETRYKGYRFRSRTEARWAVFFDNFMVNKWEYEKEGFELPSRRYLPDFWFEWGFSEQGHPHGWWMEVKGEVPFSDTSIECRLCQELSTLSKQEVILVSGIPSWDELYHFFPDGWRHENIGDILGDVDRVQYAIDAAKSARFEHGES